MRGVLWGGVIVITAIIQATLVPYIKIFDAKPDLLLILAVLSGMLYGREQGLGIGFFGGLLQDLCSGGIFGLNVLAKMITGFLSGLTEHKVFKENILLPLLAIAMATVCHFVISLLLLMMFGIRIEFVAVFLHRLLPLMLYNMVFAIPMNKLVWKLGNNENN